MSSGLRSDRFAPGWGLSRLTRGMSAAAVSQPRSTA